MLVQVGPPAPSETAPPNGVLPVIPGDGKELVEIGAGNCHSDAMRGTVPESPDRPTKIVLRRSLESARTAAIPVMWLYTVGAERVYARAGWHSVETVQRHGRRPVTLMRRDLTSGDPPVN